MHVAAARAYQGYVGYRKFFCCTLKIQTSFVFSMALRKKI